MAAEARAPLPVKCCVLHCSRLHSR
jgi:hypothetical protein